MEEKTKEEKSSRSKKLFIIIPAAIVLLLIAIGAAVNLKKKGSKNEGSYQNQTEETYFSESFGLNERNFKIGTAGYVPANFPDLKIEDVIAFWKDVESIDELYGVHTDWRDTNLIDVAAKSQKHDIVLVLGFQKPEEWQKEADAFIAKADSFLDKYSMIKYLAIGNEINMLKEENSAKFDSFLNSYEKIYEALKKEHPTVKIFTTFNYETLKGAGYLTGKKHAPSFEIIQKIGSKMDLVGLTVYPYFDHKSPTEIPDDYFRELRKYTLKPIAVTETGWMSREKYGGKLSALNEYAGSEDEQAEYLKKLASILKSEETEFVDWIFINDIQNWSEGDVPKNNELFDSVGLKKNDGKPKKVWHLWQELGKIDYKSK